MAIRTVTGGGVTVSMSAPSFPPSMDVGNACEDFRAWLVSFPGISGVPRTFSARCEWIDAGVVKSSNVSNTDWLTMAGGVGDAFVSGISNFA